MGAGPRRPARSELLSAKLGRAQLLFVTGATWRFRRTPALSRTTTRRAPRLLVGVEAIRDLGIPKQPGPLVQAWRALALAAVAVGIGGIVNAAQAADRQDFTQIERGRLSGPTRVIATPVTPSSSSRPPAGGCGRSRHCSAPCSAPTSRRMSIPNRRLERREVLPRQATRPKRRRIPLPGDTISSTTPRSAARGCRSDPRLLCRSSNRCATRCIPTNCAFCPTCARMARAEPPSPFGQGVAGPSPSKSA